MLMYLLHMGMKKGWWKDIDSSPLYAPAGRLVVDDVAAHEDLGESTCGLLSSKSVKDSNKYMSRLEGSTSSNAQFGLNDIGKHSNPQVLRDKVLARPASSPGFRHDGLPAEDTSGHTSLARGHGF